MHSFNDTAIVLNALSQSLGDRRSWLELQSIPSFGNIGERITHVASSEAVREWAQCAERRISRRLVSNSNKCGSLTTCDVEGPAWRICSLSLQVD